VRQLSLDTQLRVLEKAIDNWRKAREFEATGRLLRASRSYIRGMGRLFTITVHGDAGPHTYVALGEMSRAAALISNGFFTDTQDRGLARQATRCARAALAGTHVADPTDGDPARIGGVLADGNPYLVERLLADDDDHDEFLTPAQRIAAAAEARVLLAELLLQHRGRLDESDRGWPIGSGGPVRYAKQQHRFLRAMLPNCAGLSIDAEMTRLAEEATLSYAGLGESTRRDHAEALLATIKQRA
jgi:hypothetical protein